MCLSEFQKVFAEAEKAIKARSKGKFVSDFYDKAMDLTVLFFMQQQKRRIDNVFNYLYSASLAVFKKKEYELDDLQPAELPNGNHHLWNVNKFTANTPLFQLFFITAKTLNEIEKAEQYLKTLIKVRTIRCSPGVLSPYHNGMPVKDWIRYSLDKVGLQPLKKYKIYSFGIATDEVDPREFNFYRTDKLIEEVFFDD